MIATAERSMVNLDKYGVGSEEMMGSDELTKNGSAGLDLNFYVGMPIQKMCGSLTCSHHDV